MGRKGWGRQEKSAIQKAFIECQVHAEHMVSSNRCCEGDKKRNGIHILALRWRRQRHSTVSSILDADILTLLSKHVCMKSRSQQRGACKNIVAASVCVCVCIHTSMCGEGGESEEKGYVNAGVGLGANKESCLGKKVLSCCVPSITFWPNAFAKFSKTPVASSHVPLLAGRICSHHLPDPWDSGSLLFQICFCLGLL